MSKNGRRFIGALLFGVLVYGAFTLYAGYPEVSAVLGGFRWSAFAAACGLALGNYLLRFLKWEFYLARLDVRDVRKDDSLLIFLSGFVLSVTPGKVGEVFKSVLLRDTYGTPIARTAPIVVADRLADLIGVTILILVGLRGLQFNGAWKWALVGAGLVGACLVVIMSRGLSEGIIRAIERLPGPFRRLGPKLHESYESLRVMAEPRALWLPAVLSVAAWALEGLALWVILQGLAAHIRASAAVFFYSTSTLAGAVVPLLPGGLGVTEGALAGQLKLLGGTTEGVAMASMFLVRLATLWFAVAVGFVALGLLRWRYPALKMVQPGSKE